MSRQRPDSPGVRTADSGTAVRASSLAGFERSALSVSGLVLLTAAKAMDALTTGVGLRYVPGIYEANPIADAAFRRLGIVDGLFWSSFVVIVAITLITEAVATAVAARRPDGHLAPVVRIVGYGIPALVFAAVSVYNARSFSPASRPPRSCDRCCRGPRRSST